LVPVESQKRREMAIEGSRQGRPRMEKIPGTCSPDGEKRGAFTSGEKGG